MQWKLAAYEYIFKDLSNNLNSGKQIASDDSLLTDLIGLKNWSYRNYFDIYNLQLGPEHNAQGPESEKRFHILNW